MPGLCGGYNPFGAKNGRETETLGVVDETIHDASMILVDANVDMSNETKPGWLGYIRDYTTQLYGDYNKPI